jgi:hypothetical protein
MAPRAIIADLSYGDVLGNFGVKFIAPNPFSSKWRKTAFFLCPKCDKEFERPPKEVKSGSAKICCTSYGLKLRVPKLHSVWTNMRHRTLNPMFHSYSGYGGRGITLCNEWLDYMTFQSWALANGYKEGLSIDRIENNEGYSPKNCRWATPKEQCQNTRSNVFWVIDGNKLCELDACEYLGKGRQTLLSWKLGKYRMPDNIKVRVTSIMKNGIDLLPNVR